ncbi:MAG TPA: HEPN domain-containing protein [Solirubrobacterales bacterium]|nr:HEPN domain-containing protein [Solirubrobacterales bacterium]
MAAEPKSSFPVLEVEGYFWLPGHSKRFYGRIEHALPVGVQLHLFDTDLTQWEPDGPRGPGKIEVLHGEELGGRPLTLLEVFPQRWSHAGLRGDGGDVIDGFTETLLRGTHVSRRDELMVSLASCSLHGLREFLTGGLVDGGVLAAPVADSRADTLPIDLGAGVQLLLVAERAHNLNRTKESREVLARAQWTFDPPLTLTRLEEGYLRPLRDLILFATRRQSYITSLSINPDLEDPYSVGILQRAYPRPRETPAIYALALNLAEHQDPAALISKWFRLRRKIGPVWGSFFASLDRSESLLEDRLFGLLSFAEGYDRALRPEAPLSADEEKAAKAAIKKALPDPRVRAVYKGAINHANTKTLRARLDYLIDNATSVLDGWDLDRDLLRDQLVDTRNWLVHWGERGRHVVEDGQGLVNLVRRLGLVLCVNVLLELGVDQEVAANVVASGWRLDGLP